MKQEINMASDQSIHTPGEQAGYVRNTEEALGCFRRDEDHLVKRYESQEELCATEEESERQTIIVKRKKCISESFHKFKLFRLRYLETTIPINNSELIAKVHQFSDESKHTPGTYMEVKFNFKHYTDEFFQTSSLYLYANGTNNKNKGYVSLRFILTSALSSISLDKDFAFSYSVSVIDSSGNEKFLRSFTFPFSRKYLLDDGECLMFKADRYIKRGVLYSDPTDLLPKDCLSLCVKAVLFYRCKPNVESSDELSMVRFSKKIEEPLDEMYKYKQELTRITEESTVETHSFELIAKVHQFSDESIHTPGEQVEFDFAHNPEYKIWWRPSVYLYANGTDNESKGCVSLRFTLDSGVLRYFLNKDFELYNCVSVIDSSGNKRFLQSFTFSYSREYLLDDGERLTFTIDRYVKRKTLLSDPLDLLPKDCLSLCIEANLKMFPFRTVELKPDFVGSCKVEVVDNRLIYYLNLHTVLAERLKQFSTYFQRMSESGMKETTTLFWRCPADEFAPFSFLCDLLFGVDGFRIESLHEICEAYAIADKYDIPAAIEICRLLLISFLRVKNDKTIVKHVDEIIPELLELAEKLSDDPLKKILESFSEQTEGAEVGKRPEEDVKDYLDTEWEVEVEENISEVNREGGKILLSFKLSKNIKKNQQTPQFDFYH